MQKQVNDGSDISMSMKPEIDVNADSTKTALKNPHSTDDLETLRSKFQDNMTKLSANRFKYASEYMRAYRPPPASYYQHRSSKYNVPSIPVISSSIKTAIPTTTATDDAVIVKKASPEATSKKETNNLVTAHHIPWGTVAGKKFASRNWVSEYDDKFVVKDFHIGLVHDPEQKKKEENEDNETRSGKNSSGSKVMGSKLGGTSSKFNATTEYQSEFVWPKSTRLRLSKSKKAPPPVPVDNNATTRTSKPVSNSFKSKLLSEYQSSYSWPKFMKVGDDVLGDKTRTSIAGIATPSDGGNIFYLTPKEAKSENHPLIVNLEDIESVVTADSLLDKESSFERAASTVPGSPVNFKKNFSSEPIMEATEKKAPSAAAEEVKVSKPVQPTSISPSDNNKKKNPVITSSQSLEIPATTTTITATKPVAESASNGPGQEIKEVMKPKVCLKKVPYVSVQNPGKVHIRNDRKYLLPKPLLPGLHCTQLKDSVISKMPGQKHSPFKVAIHRGSNIPRTEYMDTMGEALRPFDHLKSLETKLKSKKKQAEAVVKKIEVTADKALDIALRTKRIEEGKSKKVNKLQASHLLNLNVQLPSKPKFYVTETADQFKLKGDGRYANVKPKVDSGVDHMD